MAAVNDKKNGTNVIENPITNEERTYFSKKMQEAEEFDNTHKETYTLNDIINKHREKYEF